MTSPFDWRNGQPSIFRATKEARRDFAKPPPVIDKPNMRQIALPNSLKTRPPTFMKKPK